MNRTSVIRTLLTIVVMALAGCAHYTVNAPKKADSKEGYYYANIARTNNSEEILMCLAFSGGGTRAASFSYGLLEALRDTTYEVDGEPRRFLDEVDIISSVSGGSFTAAAYGLYGDKIFEVLEPAFLKRNVQGALFLSSINPLNWPALWSKHYSRSDLAAKYYDKILFHGATFANLQTNNTPFIVMNGTDIATGNRIPFSQYMFDVFSSDLDPYPLAMAAAASSAVPGILTPVTLNNYAGEFTMKEPEWVTRDYPEDAVSAKSYTERLKDYLNGTNYPYLHLSDGGVSDNLGLRLYLDNIATVRANPGLLDSNTVEKVKKVVFILSNAFVKHESNWDKKSSSPHAIPVMAAADARTMQRYSEDTVLWLREMLIDFRRQRKIGEKVEIYFIEIDFKNLGDPALVHYFLSLPTSFVLSTDVVDKLINAAHDLLKDNPEFKQLLNDLGATYGKKQ